MPEQNYTFISFANLLKSSMNAELNHSYCEFHITYTIDKLTSSISLIDKRSIKPDILRWIICSDDNLKQGLYTLMTL